MTLMAVISGAQCFNVCSFQPSDEPRPAHSADSGVSPCHRSPASSTPDPARTHCTHEASLAATTAKTTSVDSVVLVVVPIAFQYSVPVYIAEAVKAAQTQGSPPTEQSLESAILRL